MERRLQREVERSKSNLYKSRGVRTTDYDASSSYGEKGMMNGHAGPGSMALQEEEEERRRKQGEEGLTAEQVQSFREENEVMLRHYEDTLDQVRYTIFLLPLSPPPSPFPNPQRNHITNTIPLPQRTAEKSMLEVSELQTTLVANLSTQSSNIEQLVSDSLSTTENIGTGNKELKRATQRKSTARMVFWASCGLCAFLVGWDLVF